MHTGPHPLAIAVFALALALAGFIAVIALIGKASDGDPTVSFDLAPFPEAPLPAVNTPQAETSLSAPPVQGVPGNAEAPIATPSAVSSATPGSRFVNGNLAADPALLVHTLEGALPVIGPDGRKPMAAYASAFNSADMRPRVAVVVGGLGISVSATRLALDHLPPAITLSFAPYASDVQHWVDAARGAGHEVLVEVPMEPLGIPGTDPGPYTLLVTASRVQNLQHLSWALSRFTGYVGATNLLGGRFLSQQDAIGPVMAALEKRGLLFFDNGVAAHSAAARAAKLMGTAFVTGTIVLDAAATRDAINAKLAALESAARANGAGVASGLVYPVTIQLLAEWAKTLEARGLVLTPLSAVVATENKAPAQ